MAATQFLYAPPPRLRAISLPRPGSGGSGGASGGVLVPGLRLWAGRPVSAYGAQVGGPAARCRFDQTESAGGWISSALVRCEAPVELFEPPLQIAEVRVAGGGGEWSLELTTQVVARARDTDHPYL